MTDGSAQQPPAPAPAPETPYVGLVPYGEEDAAFFFGRDDETWIVGGNLRASGLTLLYGASGVGKTSLLRAGVIHGLHSHIRQKASPHRQRAPFSVCVFAGWRDDPLSALMETIRLAANEALGEESLPPWQPGDPVAETLHVWTERVRTLLVVLDQFEDYFLYHPDEDGDGTFAGEFPAIVNDPNLRVHFLLSIREDALAKLDRFKGRIPRLFANYFRVEHLNRHAARDAIEGPVREWNRRQSPSEEPYALEPALVDAVIDSAATGGLALVRSGAGTEVAVDREHIEAPFLQLVMDRLWRATVEAGSSTLTVARLEQLGGAQRIVENHLLDALGALSSDEREVAADLFRFLVTRSKTKIAHPASDLAEWTSRSEPDVTAVLDKLCRGESGRILRRVPPPPTGDGATRYELFHDVLAEPILEWRREYEQERRRRATRRRFVRVGGGLLALVALFTSLGVWALVQRSDAQSASKARRSLALTTAARAELPEHVERSLLLGLEAYRAKPSGEAVSGMVEALEAARRSGAVTILRGDPTGVRAIAFSQDGRTLASANFNGTIQLWDTKARTGIRTLYGHTSEVWGLAFSPDGSTLASSGFDGTLRLWNVADQQPLGDPMNLELGALRSVAFSPNGRMLAVAGSDDTVRLWDVPGRKLLEPPLRGHRAEVVSVVFSSDGRTLASGGYDRTVRLWDVRTRKALGKPLEGHNGEVWTVAFSPDGRTLASGDRDGTARLWDVRTQRPLGAPLNGDTGEIWSVAFSPSGRVLASSGFDDTVRLWDVRSHDQVGAPLRGHSQGVISVSYRSDGVLASASFDGTVRLWNPQRHVVLGEPLLRDADRITTVAFSPNGSLLASGGFDRTIRLWNVRTRKLVRRIGVDSTDSLESLAFSPDGRTLASAEVDGTIGLWRIPNGMPVGELRGHEGAVSNVAFSPDGQTLASAGFDSTVRLWDLERESPLGGPQPHLEDPIWSLAFSPDGRTLVYGGSDLNLHFWDLESSTEELVPGGLDEILTVAFAPSGDTLASGSVGGSVRLLDPRAREAIGQLRAHTDTVESVSFSPDGRKLASASSDGTVRLWDASESRSLGAPLGDGESPVYSVAFSPDRRTVASGDDDAVRLWEGILWSDLADLETQICSLVVGNLTELEWQELVPGIAYRSTCPS